LILRFDEAFYLFSALDELLQDTDCNQYFDQAFHSQASFLEWKDFIVTIAQQSQLA
jgi:predicted Zn-dependent protease